MMRHKVILTATVRAMLISSPKECERFFRDSHDVSLYLGLGPDGFDLAAKPSRELLRTGVRLSSAPLDIWSGLNRANRQNNSLEILAFGLAP